MRFYNRQHTYYCGIDLHVKTMYVSEEVRLHSHKIATPAATRRTTP